MIYTDIMTVSLPGQEGSFNGSILDIGPNRKLLAYRPENNRVAAHLLDSRYNLIGGYKELCLQDSQDPRIFWYKDRIILQTNWRRGKGEERRDRIELSTLTVFTYFP